MGNFCCSDLSESRVQEIEEGMHKERMVFGTEVVENGNIYIQSEPEDSNKSNFYSAVLRVARRYLNSKFLKKFKELAESGVECKVLFTSLPITPGTELIEDRIPLFEKPEDTGISIRSFPAVLLPDGRLYEGQWDLTSKLPSGFGTMIYVDQSKYTGQLINGKKSGKGRLIKLDGEYFEGFFLNDLYEGYGVLNKANGLIYKGSFVGGKENGEGIIEYEAEVVYKGEFASGAKHGKGHLKIREGSSYCGEFVNNLMEGQGVYVWEDGKRYEGGWKGNKLNGEGKYSWPDGREYYGCYYEGNRDGFGIFKWPDGREYRGEWLNGNMHGIGSYTVVSKSGETKTIKAYWEHGKKKKALF